MQIKIITWNIDLALKVHYNNEGHNLKQEWKIFSQLKNMNQNVSNGPHR